MAIFALTCGFFSVYHFHIILPSVSCTCLNTTIGFFFLILKMPYYCLQHLNVFFFFFSSCHIYFCCYLTYAGFTIFFIIFFTFFFFLWTVLLKIRENSTTDFSEMTHFSPLLNTSVLLLWFFSVSSILSPVFDTESERDDKGGFLSVSQCLDAGLFIGIYLCICRYLPVSLPFGFCFSHSHWVMWGKSIMTIIS